MRPALLKNLILSAGLALSPALSSAQGVTNPAGSPLPSPDQAITSPDDEMPKSPADQATPPSHFQSDALAYQRELEACDRQPADQDTCRAQVDQRHTNKGSTIAPGQSSR